MITQKYLVSVNRYAGSKDIEEWGDFTVDATSPMLACEQAERVAALLRDGTLAYLPQYFAARVRLAQHRPSDIGADHGNHPAPERQPFRPAHREGL